LLQAQSEGSVDVSKWEAGKLTWWDIEQLIDCRIVRASANVRDLLLRPTARLVRVATGFVLGGFIVGSSGRLLHSGLSSQVNVSDDVADEVARELRQTALLRMALQRQADESDDETDGVFCNATPQVSATKDAAAGDDAFANFNLVPRLLHLREEGGVCEHQMFPGSGMPGIRPCSEDMDLTVPQLPSTLARV